jgi:hypothetical protein
MTAPLPVLSPSSILPPPLSHSAFLPPKEIFGAPFKNAIISNLYPFLQFLKIMKICSAVIWNFLNRGVSVQSNAIITSLPHTIYCLAYLKPIKLCEQKFLVNTTVYRFTTNFAMPLQNFIKPTSELYWGLYLRCCKLPMLTGNIIFLWRLLSLKCYKMLLGK